MNKLILIVVPYKARDLEGLALVGFHLERRHGCEVVYSNGYGLEQKILKLAPDCLVLDHLAWDFKVAQARLCKSLGIKVIILPTEGLFQDEEGAARRAGKLHHASNLPDKYLTWGDYPRRALLKQNLMTAAQVETHGCPRFDLYSEPYLSLICSRETLTQKLGFQNAEAPLILWATNTAYATRNAAKMLERQTKKAKKPTSEVQAHIEDHQTQFREHSRVVVELARRNPEYNFIIKVHPAEWINPYLEICRTNPNIKLAFDAPIQEFLFHADVLLQRNCTTATEAWMLGKPVLNLEIGAYRQSVRREYARGNHHVFDVDEANAVIKLYLNKMPVPPEQIAARAEFIRDFYFRNDGKSAARVAAAISETVSPPAYDEAIQKTKNQLTAQKLSDWQTAQDRSLTNKFKDFCGINRSQSLRFWKPLLRRESRANAALFVAEPEITPAMIREIYAKYETLEQLQTFANDALAHAAPISA